MAKNGEMDEMAGFDRFVPSRGRLLMGSALVALAVSAPAMAQSTASQEADSASVAADEAASEVITVTGSRISGNFTAPTPTTVIGTAAIQSTAPLQISEALQLIPSFRQTTTSSSSAVYANLRSIGATRTLVLIDGRRHVPTTSEGTFDLNLIPTNLVSRTEVVTGGASASWGSDAVAGVINLLLRTDMEGIELSAQSGISEYGDGASHSVSLTAGTRFAGGRGHILFGGEYARDYGIGDLQPPDISRPWAGRDRVSNAAFATNGLPGVLYASDVRRADTSVGGLITNGPLRGLTFNSDGSLRPFGYGEVFGNNMIGGTDNFAETTTPGSDLRYPTERYTALLHTEFEISPAATLFAEGSYAHALSAGTTNAVRFQGSVAGATNTCAGTTAPTSLGGILVNIDNPYLPDEARAAMNAAGVSCIQVGRTFRDIGSVDFNDGTGDAWRGVVGGRGELGGGWKWDGYFQYGKSSSQQLRIGNVNMENFRRAIDAVRSPTDEIICRSTLTDPGDGCVPLNIFGHGSATQAAAAYVTGTSSLLTDITQKVASLNLSGEPLSLWAGPIGVAFGAEYREETIDSVADARAEVNGWQTGNRKSTKGKFDIREVYGELTVPLLRDMAIVNTFELNGAVRYADYSSSGGVTTWKVGATLDLAGGVRLRGTRSRDIRAGNLGELFTPVSTATSSGLRNPLTGESSPALVVTQGNRTLSPEKADTWTVGITYTPAWLPGLRFAVDYYDIEINGAIGTLTPQQIIDRCYLDTLQDFCDLIQTNTAGRITQVTTQQLNLNRFNTRGVDIEASYNTRFLTGDLGLRVLANYVDTLATTASINAKVVDVAGQYTTPHWTALGTVSFAKGPFRALADLRWYEGGTIDNTLTEGAISATGVNINKVDSSFYTNLTLTYTIDEDRRREIFFRVNNLFDSWPPFPSTGNGFFDELGRAYRVGVRFGF